MCFEVSSQSGSQQDGHSASAVGVQLGPGRQASKAENPSASPADFETEMAVGNSASMLLFMAQRAKETITNGIPGGFKSYSRVPCFEMGP